MKYDKYHNCLRLQITPDEHADERIAAAVEHCVQYGFDNIMLMFNAEEFNVGHMTKAEAAVWLEVLKKAKREFERAGISVSLNYWLEMGHLGRGRKLKSGQNFMSYTDMEGTTDGFVACPLDENWRAYYADFVKYVVGELRPDTFWIEDDFRLHNHPPAKGIGCFCDGHMQYYNSRLGTSYTREEFVRKVFAIGGLNKERKVYLDANRDVILETAEIITAAVKEASPQTEVALMSSSPSAHCVEARDWHALFDILSRGGNKIHRIHLPCYEEQAGKEYLYHFNSISMGVRALCPEDNIVMPEIENGATSAYRKGPRFLRFALEASVPLLPKGMTYSLYGFEGNGPRDSLGFGKVVQGVQPYMQAVMDLHTKFGSMQGVIVPIDGKAAYYKTIENDYRDLTPREFNAAAYLSGLGIAYKYSDEKNVKGQTVFLTGGSVDCFDDKELKSLFENNYILLDGGAALKLKERNMLFLIGADNAQLRAAESGYQTYEEHCGNGCIDGVKNMRASCRLAAGDFVEITYAKHVDVFSKVYNELQKSLGACAVKGKNFAVLPFVIDKKLISLFCDLRKYFISEVVAEHSAVCAVGTVCGISPYLFKEKDRSILMLVNSNTDTFDSVTLTLKCVLFTKISRVKKDGGTEEVAFTREKDGQIVLHLPLEYLSSETLVLT